MNIIKVGQKYGELKRVAEIIRILFKYGLEDIFDKNALAQKFNIASGTADKKNKEIITPEKVRMALQELGPAFVKLGQLLSTRPDIIPANYIVELQKLQDKVAPFSYQEVKSQIHASLGDTIEHKFKEFEREPVAAASMAQVHIGILPDGKKVAVKIKRPHIEKIILEDTEIILELAQFIKNNEMVDESWRPTEIAEEFKRSIQQELDFSNEINNQNKFYNNFLEEKNVKIPQIFADYSKKDIITMEYLQGTKLRKIINAKGQSALKKHIANVGAHAILKQIFIDHFFHGDLHPGNLFWLDKEDKLGFIDFGLVGIINQAELKALTMMLMGVTENDATKLTLGIEGLGIIDTSEQSLELKSRIEKMLEKYYDARLEDIQMSIFIKEIFDIMHDLQIRFPVDLVVLAKSLISVEGFAIELNPTFNMFTFCRPYIEAALKEQYDLKHIKNDLENTFFESMRFAKGLPNDLYWILKRIKNNNFKIKLEHLKLQSLLEGIERTGNRLSFSLIVAALIIGSSYVIPNSRGLGLFGYIMASLLGLGLVISMLKKNKL